MPNYYIGRFERNLQSFRAHGRVKEVPRTHSGPPVRHNNGSIWRLVEARGKELLAKLG